MTARLIKASRRYIYGILVTRSSVFREVCEMQVRKQGHRTDVEGGDVAEAVGIKHRYKKHIIHAYDLWGDNQPCHRFGSGG